MFQHIALDVMKLTYGLNIVGFLYAVHTKVFQCIMVYGDKYFKAY